MGSPSTGAGWPATPTPTPCATRSPTRCSVRPGLPDLGALFPATDDTYRDASSLVLLRDVVARVTAAGWSVANVDVVVNAEEPRLAPHLDAMTASVRDALGGAHVSITPKRGEGIGTVGRREGIQCWAVALLESVEPSRG